MLTLRAMTGAAGYAARHLEHNDYYAENQRIVGQWYGHGAGLLGLEGEVKPEHFEAVRQGLDPETGEFLRPRQSADRLAPDGATQAKARTLYDLTFSAPKSVSIQAELGGDKRLPGAFDRALKETLAETEKYAATRVRLAGANEDRRTGNLILAVYRHDSSRELDPQLHAHAVAANMTYDGMEGRWKALQASDLYQRRAYLTEVFRNALAREVRSLGYEIENRRDPRGKDLGFEIKGVSDELLIKYSQRSQQRDEAIAQFVANNGRAPSDNEVAVLVRESRSDKLQSITPEEVEQIQRARLAPEEGSALEQLRQQAECSAGQEVLHQPAAPSLAYAQQHLFERLSVACEHELLTEALRHGRGRIALPELEATLRSEESRGQLLRAGHDLATHSSLQRERSMIAAINHGIGRHERLGGGQEFISSDRLRPEQKRAVHFVLDSHDFAVNLRGAAGTGKTATLQELARGLREAGREVQPVAPTMSAVEELQKVGFRQAVTVERLLQDPQAQSSLNRKVLIVDEAGMVSGRQMAGLLELAERQHARLLFSGDTRQLQSIEACDALRILERESQMKSTSLTQVQRQTEAQYRQAIEQLRRSPDEGFRQLEQLGAVREVGLPERARQVALAYSEIQRQPNAHGNARSVLVVAPTHQEIGHLTEAIREHRKRSGELGESVRLDRHLPLHWTLAQRSEPRNYQPGLILAFHRATKDVGKNESLEVVRAAEGKIVARNDHGQEIELTRKQAQSFAVYQRQAIEVAPQDRLLLQSNRRESGFRSTNGELVTVQHVDAQRRVHLDDGRVLPANYGQFDHGYAITAHGAQGKTVDAVVISGDAMKRELFYVAASRGREQVLVLTSDRELLRGSVGLTGERQSATELARKAHEHRPGLEPGPWRGLEAAQDLAWQQRHTPQPDLSRQAIVPTLDLEQAPAALSQKQQQPLQEITHGFGHSL